MRDEGAPEAEASPPGRTRLAPARNVLVAVILSGLGPGAGHAYVGRPARGAVLLMILLVASVAFILAVPVSYEAARLWSIPLMMLVLAILADAGRLARRAPRPFPAARWQSAWTYAAIVVMTGFIVPGMLTELLSRHAGIVVASDDAMDPAILEGDWLVQRRHGEPRRGDVVVVPREGRAPALRRVVGLPGEKVSVTRGTAQVAGVEIPLALARPMFAQDLTLPSVTLSSGEILALGDRRRRDDAVRVSRADLAGRASWILVPADDDISRIGATP